MRPAILVLFLVLISVGAVLQPPAYCTYGHKRRWLCTLGRFTISRRGRCWDCGEAQQRERDGGRKGGQKSRRFKKERRAIRTNPGLPRHGTMRKTSCQRQGCSTSRLSHRLGPTCAKSPRVLAAFQHASANRTGSMEGHRRSHCSRPADNARSTSTYVFLTTSRPWRVGSRTGLTRMISNVWWC